MSLAWGGWNGVVSACAPGVTTGQATHHEYRSARRAVGRDGLDGVVRARGVKPALIAQPWATDILVRAQQRDQDGLHRFSIFSQYCASALRIAVGRSGNFSGCATTTISIPLQRARQWRNDSRTWRLTRFRTTALAAARRLTVMPSLTPGNGEWAT